MSFPEQDRAVQILEKEFGPRWKQIVQELGTKELRQRVGKELTSFMAFPERGSGGNNKWRGNCSPEVVRAILRYVLECKHYYGKQTQDFTLLDPMSGSGTSQAAAQSLGVRSLLYDLNPAPACGITQRTRTESCELSVRVTLPPKASRRESPDLPHSPSRLDLSLKSDYTNNKYRT